MATKLCDFAPVLVPGLLQTAVYARAVTLATNPFATDEYVGEKVTARMERAHILDDATRPEYWAILHENVVRIPVGGHEVMADQLEHIAALARERKVLITVIPHAAGAFAAMAGMMTLMEFEDAPPTAYTEAVYSGTLLDDPALVKRMRATYDLLRAAGLVEPTSGTAGRGQGVPIGHPGALRVVVASALLAPVCALVSLGLGALIRHSATTMVLTTGVLLLLPVFVTERYHWTACVRNALLYNAWFRLVDLGYGNEPFTPAPRYPTTVTGGWIVFGVWVFVAAVVAVVAVDRRDV